MAESENIGGVSISVDADFSALDAAFDAAVQRAVADGQSLSDAIASAVKAPDFSAITGAADQLGERWQQVGQEMATALGITLPAPDVSAVTAAMDQIGQSAKDAGDQLSLFGNSNVDFADSTGQLNLFADALEITAQDCQSAASALAPVKDELTGTGEAASTAGGAVEGAAGSFGSLVESLAGLVILDKLQSTLDSMAGSIAEATDAFTRANIALTTITGSSEQAEATIKGLEQLGQTDGLAMPALLTAATRMERLLPAGTDVVGILGHIADGAAVMGTSIDAAANAFDRIVNSGTVSARQLTALGLSTSTLADALNQLNPALEATAQNAGAAFKALDPGDRITVLQNALQGLAGTAQQVAQQTFGGQWQTLANQWEETLNQVGQALLPVVSALTKFASEGLAAIQDIATAFNQLPGPVKDAAAAFVILGGALVTIGAGVAAVALAIGPLEGMFAAVNWRTIVDWCRNRNRGSEPRCAGRWLR